MFSYVLNWSENPSQNFYQLRLFLEWCLATQRWLKRRQEDKQQLSPGLQTQKFLHLVRAAPFGFRAAFLCRGKVLNWLHSIPFLQRDTVCQVSVSVSVFEESTLTQDPSKFSWLYIQKQPISYPSPPYCCSFLCTQPGHCYYRRGKEQGKIRPSSSRYSAVLSVPWHLYFPPPTPIQQGSKTMLIKLDDTKVHNNLERIQRSQLISTERNIFQQPLKESYVVIFLEFLMLQSALAFQQF